MCIQPCLFITMMELMSHKYITVRQDVSIYILKPSFMEAVLNCFRDLELFESNDDK